MQFDSLVSFCSLPRLEKSVWFRRVKLAACVYFQLSELNLDDRRKKCNSWPDGIPRFVCCLEFVSGAY